MKRLKHYSIRKDYTKDIINKTVFGTFLSLFTILLINFFWTSIITTNVLWKIPKKELLEKAKQITFNWTVWPIKKITDISSRTLRYEGISYQKIRKENWVKIPDTMKVSFPKEIKSYIDKYQNITLQQAPKVFSDSDDYNKFTFMRRIIRATWTASYESKNIWKRNTWTHAWVDIISNVWTPIYSIANGLVVEKKEWKRWFWKFIAILHKVEDKYYVSFYGHLHSLNNNIKVGDFVKKWQLIWTMWDSWNAFWSHLHLQINKVFTLQDMVNGRVTIGWYHDLDGVKAYTADPIAFVEKYNKWNWDNLSYLKISKNKVDNTIKATNDTKLSPSWKRKVNKDNIVNLKNKAKITKVKTIKKENTDFVDDISTELDKKIKETRHSSAPEKSYIKDIKIKLVDNKIQLWYPFEAILSVHPGHWTISVIASNDNLQFIKDKIEDPSQKQYTVQFVAQSIWKTTITFNDWKSSRSYDITIYKKDMEKVSWIEVKVKKLNLLSKSKIAIYPINKFWQIIDLPFRWIFKIYLKTNNDKKFVQNIQVDWNEYVWYIKWNVYWKWKIIVESDKFYSKTNVIVDIAKDYSYNNEYANDMFELIKNWVVKWENGKLFPNRKITRRELLTIIWRSILKTDYDKLKLQMQNYVLKHGKFFKDIWCEAYSDPYIYLAWKKDIIKWENGYSLSNTYVTKWELLTIFTRLFKIKIKEEQLNVWADLKDWTQLKKIADTVKKYGLYPFKNYNRFNSWKNVSRLIAFETLQRFIDFWNADTKYLSSNVEQKEIKQQLNQLFEF